MDPAFRTSFSEALARSLLENEEKENQENPGGERRGRGGRQGDEAEDLVRSTFEQLHFDQPVGLTSRGCRLLSKALIDPKRPQYALSSRLIGGFRQVVDRHRSGRHEEPVRRPALPDGDQNEPVDHRSVESIGDGSSESLMRPPSGSGSVDDLNASISLLAWTICGRIPLRVLCYEDPHEALLGSYRGTTPPAAPDAAGQSSPLSIRGADSPQVDPEEPMRYEGVPPPVREHPQADEIRDEDGNSDSSTGTRSSRQPPLGRHLNGSNHHPVDADDDNEVWADESDPSDYDYGGDESSEAGLHHDEQQQHGTPDPPLWMLPPSETMPLTHQEVAQALLSLLSELSFRNLAALAWTSTVEEELTQLSLVLLLPRNHRHGSSVLKCMDETVWQQAALRPVHMLRDAAAFHPDRLPAYLQLLRSVIKVHEVSVLALQPSLGSTDGSSSGAPSLPPATWLALSLLSSLCSSTCADAWSQTQVRHNVPQQVELVHNCLVECMDHLVDILDEIMKVGSSGTDSPTHDAGQDPKSEFLPSLLAPLFNCLALPLSASTNQTQSYQIMLNSGLFRQWLLLFQYCQQTCIQPPTSDSRNDRVANRACMELSLLELCAASPKLLGKYAWRFPAFASAVTKLPTSCYPLEWNLLGIELSSDFSSNKVKWKSPSVSLADPAPTVMACQVEARVLFQQQFDAMEKLITHWRGLRRESKAESRDADAVERHHRELRVLIEFEALVNRLVRFPLFRETFRRLEVPDGDQGDRWMLSQFVEPLQRLLAAWPKQQREMGAKSRLKAKLDDSYDATVTLPPTDSHVVQTSESISGRDAELPLWEQGAQDAAVEALRRSLKTFQSLVDQPLFDSVTSCGALSHRIAGFSSKAD